MGIINTPKAIGMARDVGLDLVEVAPTSNPPVCRVMDYGKYQYEQKRKIREAKKKSQHSHSSLKEVRMRPETDTHDLDIKVNRARKFLGKGHKVQFTMMFRGRQMLHQDRGRDIFNDIAETLADIAKVEQTSKMTHRRMIMTMVPLK